MRPDLKEALISPWRPRSIASRLWLFARIYVVVFALVFATLNLCAVFVWRD